MPPDHRVNTVDVEKLTYIRMYLYGWLTFIIVWKIILNTKIHMYILTSVHSTSINDVITYSYCVLGMMHTKLKR